MRVRAVFLYVCGAIVALALGGCGSAPRQPETRQPETRQPEPRAEQKPLPSKPATARVEAARAPTPTLRAPRGGGYYLDDGPGDSPPPDLDSIPEPVPQLEPLHRGAMRPYVVLGQAFTPMTELQPYKARGIATWYGRRYHGKQTSTGEIYDMYGISAAHPTLPLPSYARVTHLASGRSIVVRVNDRGPFLDGRLIDLSYTAAHRLGVIAGGSALVEVESIIPDGTTPGTAYAVAPGARVKAAPAQSASATSRAGVTAGRYDNHPDPILAIAAAAGDASASPAGAPSASAAGRQSSTPAPTPTTESGGIYLQLGAFGSRENAESYLERARVQFDWLAERLQVRPREGLFRVQAGPYANASEARLAAERIATTLGNRPVLSR